MKSSKGQLTAIIVLMIALLMQMEGKRLIPEGLIPKGLIPQGLIPKGLMLDIFAGSEVPIILIEQVDGLELTAEIDSKAFTDEKELIIKATVTNKSGVPIDYYSETTSTGFKEVIGAAISAIDGNSSFTHKHSKLKEASEGTMVWEGRLEPGRTLSNNFNMLPFYRENGSVKHVAPGHYIMSVWFRTDAETVVKAEFNITVTKRFGRMYIKNS